VKRVVSALIVLLMVSGCVADTGYTLYRTNIDPVTRKEIPKRVYVATFDVPRSEFDDQVLSNYNSVNCNFAEKLFNAEQPHFKGSIYEHIKVFYWCEKGGYRP